MTRYHAHRRGHRAFTLSLLLRGLGEGAVFLFCLGVVVFMLWMVSP